MHASACYELTLKLRYAREAALGYDNMVLCYGKYHMDSINTL